MVLGLNHERDCLFWFVVCGYNEYVEGYDCRFFIPQLHWTLHFDRDAFKQMGTRGGAVGWGNAPQTGRSRFRFRWWLGFDPVSNRFEYQEYFPECKDGRCLDLTTLPSLLSRNLGVLISWNPRWALTVLYQDCFVFYFIVPQSTFPGPGSSVGIATDCGLDRPGSNPCGDEIFRSYRPALGPTQPPVKWVPGLSRG